MPDSICGTVSNSGAKGEPLACAFDPNHTGNHSWATLPPAITTADTGGNEKPTRNFLTKLREILKDLVEPEQWQAAIKKARGYAGGKTSPKKPQMASYYSPYEDDDSTSDAGDDPTLVTIKYEKADSRVNYRAAADVGKTCNDCAHFCDSSCAIVEGNIDSNYTCDLIAMGVKMREPDKAQDIVTMCAADASPRGFKLFVEIPKAFATPPDWIPFMPKPGSYTHPEYGKINLTSERLARFVQHFNSGVYQKHIPIDAEHETKLSGAYGWLDQLRQNADGSVDAHVEEWTDRGRSAVEANRFRYISPEWYDKWRDPMSEKVYADIAIGAALCVRPFFKEGGLRSLVASERGLEEYKPTGGDPMPEPAQATDDLAAKLATEETARKAVEEQLKQANDRVKKLEDTGRRKRFTDIVKGRSDENTTPWAGDDAGKQVDFLMKLSDSFGEDSEEVKGYIARETANAARLMASGLFDEKGTGRGSTATDAGAKLNELATKRASEQKIPLADAMSQIARENPALYRQHQAASYANKGES